MIDKAQETEWAIINVKSEIISSQPCSDGVEQPMESDKRETVKMQQAVAWLVSAPNRNKNMISSSKSLNEDELYGNKKEVPLTRASASSHVIAVSLAVSPPKETSEKVITRVIISCSFVQ